MLRGPTGTKLEVDHIQYGPAFTLMAGWDDGQVIQSGGISAGLWTGLELSGGGALEGGVGDGQNVVLTYSGLDPNETLQINVGSYGLPFYPPDPIKVVGNQIQIQFSKDGAMSTLTIDVAASSGETVDPASVVAFNPQPEPPSPGQYAFDTTPVGDTEALAIQVPLIGGSGANGETQITLSLQLLDDSMTPLPISTVARRTNKVPALGVIGLFLLGAMLSIASGRRIG